jgi:hypothetical protein
MNKSSVFSTFLSLLLVLIFVTSLSSCSETSKTDPVKEKSLEVSNKKSGKPSCCANGIPARFPVKSIVER